MNNPNKVYAAHTCQCQESPSVVDSRTAEYQGTEYRRRRYLCPKCEKRWTSIEIVLASDEQAAPGAMFDKLEIKFGGSTRQLDQLRMILDSLDMTISKIEQGS